MVGRCGFGSGASRFIRGAADEFPKGRQRLFERAIAKAISTSSAWMRTIHDRDHPRGEGTHAVLINRVDTTCRQLPSTDLGFTALLRTPWRLSEWAGIEPLSMFSTTTGAPSRINSSA